MPKVKIGNTTRVWSFYSLILCVFLLCSQTKISERTIGFDNDFLAGALSICALLNFLTLLSGFLHPIKISKKQMKRLRRKMRD